MEQLHETLKAIKRSFRLYMNGEASRSMREKGLNYNLNWGIPLMRLKTLSKEYPKDLDLATALWHENVRECRILALMLCPPEQMNLTTALTWGERIDNQELAEAAAIYLFQYVDNAAELASRWMVADCVYLNICAFNVMGRLFRNGWKADESFQQPFLAVVCKALTGEDLGMKHAAYNCVLNFADQCEANEATAKAVLKRQNIEIF